MTSDQAPDEDFGPVLSVFSPNSPTSQEMRNALDLPTGQADPSPEIPIVKTRRIEPANPLRDTAPDEDGRLVDHVMATLHGIREVPVGRSSSLQLPSFGVDDQTVTIDDVGGGIGLEGFDGSRDGTRRPAVVSVQPCQNLSPARLPASVNGVEGAAIRLASST